VSTHSPLFTASFLGRSPREPRTTREVVSVLNAKRTASGASRPSRLLLATLLLSLLTGLAPRTAQASLGDALALRSLLSSAHVQASAPGYSSPAGFRSMPGGRTMIDHRLLKSGALRRANATTANTVPIPNATQSFDIDNPLPAFEPLVGYGSLAVINNDPTNAALFINHLTPTNLTPVWSADQTFIVFSSNRTLTGDIQPDGRFHLWAIPASGGEAYQITGDSNTDPNIRGEFFPALSANNSKLAFVSDAQSPGVRNLFVLGASVAGTTSAGGFSFNALVANNNAQGSKTNPPYLLDVSKSDPRANGITSVTIRSTVSQADSSAQTGFGNVQRPTFSPGNDGLIVFSAFSTSGASAGHYHLYFLYTNSLGFDPNNNFSFPGKLTDGLADDTDPAWSQDGQNIAFASTANAVTTKNTNNSFGPNPPTAVQDPNQSQSQTTMTAGNTLRSIFLISSGGGSGSGFGTVPTALVDGRVTAAGTDNFGPAWSYSTSTYRNQYTNPAPGFSYLAFARGASPTAMHDISYLQTARGLDSGTQTLTPEGANLGASTNTAVTLNTDNTAGAYDNVYPTWSPFLSVFSIAYQTGNFTNGALTSGAYSLNADGTLAPGTIAGGRTVTYNDPTTANPSEVAISIPEGGTANTSDPNTQTYTVGANYSGIFQSQVLNLDPPTLLRFAPDQVIHVQASGPRDNSTQPQSLDPVNGTSNKLAVTGNQYVSFTVRLSNREAGIDNTGGPTLGTGNPAATAANNPKVFLQIKDPDSKYQDKQRLEHKVFAKDPLFTGQTNRTALNDSLGNTANFGIGLAFGGFEMGATVTGGGPYGYPSYTANPTPNYVQPRGPHGGHWIFPNGNNPRNTFIYVGKGGGGTNTGTDPSNGNAAIRGGDPALFIPTGPEYEAQLINPQFAATPGGSGTDAALNDYRSPYYLAGIDDQQAFSGSLNPPRLTVNTTDRTGNNIPAEYLQMVVSPVQDNKGGVLYTVTWRTPASVSDFYLDVIAYDKALFPNIPSDTSRYATGRSFNWRIYDNIGGFSTQTSIGNNDILFVSDYALGQKFAATTFGGQSLNQNLIPKQFGTESYMTDVDVNILPDRVYAGIPTDAGNYNFQPALNPFFGSPLRTQRTGNVVDTSPTAVRTQNALGVGSYFDSVLTEKDNGLDAGLPIVPSIGSQKYSIWRILSRGPVPDTLLQSYQPQVTQQPAVNDTQNGVTVSTPAAPVLDAHRCVIWLSPYTGSLLVDPGTLDDLDLTGVPNVNNRVRTQVALRSFVQNGGRLCITGQDVGNALTQGGITANAAGSFLPDVLNAKFASNGSGSTSLNATNNRIFGNPLFDGSGGGTNGGLRYPTLRGDIIGGFFIPGDLFFPNQQLLRLSSTDQNDGAFDEIPSNRLPGGASIQGQSDVLTPLNGAIVGASYADGTGGAALVFHDDPYAAAGPHTLPNGGTGSRTVYAGFNLGALSNDYFSSDAPNPAQSSPTVIPDLYIPDVIPHNTRAEVMHNIVTYLRTGSITGRITQTAGGNGQSPNAGVPSATVYIKSINRNAVPSTRPVFSTTTLSDGSFSILGVEPGTYQLFAYKSGYTNAVSNQGIQFTIEGDTTTTGSLTINPVPPGSIAGIVVDSTAAQTPIIGATVTITSQDNTVTRTTTTFDGMQAGQPKGDFLFSGVPVTTYTIATASGPANDQNLPQYTAATKANAPFDTSIVVQSGVTTGDGTIKGGVTFTLAPIGGSVSGRVFVGTNDAAGGAAAAGAAVQAFAGTDTTAAALAQTTADANGAYNLTGILPVASYPGTATPVTIKVSKPGFTDQTFTVALFLGDIVSNKFVGLTAILPGNLTGQVTFTNGDAASGAIVTFTPASGTGVIKTTTDTNGNYNIAAPSGTYSASAMGALNPHGTPTAAATTPITVTVQPGTPTNTNFKLTLIPPTFSGTVVSTAMAATSTTPAVAEAPLANALITVTDANTGATVGSTLTNANGAYTTAGTIKLVNGGIYTIVASLASYQSVTAQDPFTPGSQNTKITFYNGDVAVGQTFRLTPLDPGTVSGTVVDNTGVVVPGATVTLTSTDKTITRTAVTDGNGAYALPMGGVPAGSYNATVVGPNNANGKAKYTPPPAQTVTVSPSTTATANFTLTQILPTFAVTVTDATTGAALTNAPVTFTPAAGGTTTTVTANTGGVYTSPGLAPGTYTITASAPSFFDGAASATVDLGDIGTPLALALNQKATVYGLVTDSVTGAALSSVTLTLTNTTGGTAVTTTPATITTATATSAGPDGALQNYTFSLPPGTYTLTATKANYTQAFSKAFTVGNAAPVRVDLALTSSIGTLGGLVTNAVVNSTTPVGGATVTVTDLGGKVVASFTTSTSVTTGPDNQALNYTGQVLNGTYSVTVTQGTRKTNAKQVTVKGGVFTRADFSGNGGLPALYTFTAGLKFFSTPYDYSGLGFDGLFGALNTAPTGSTPNGNRSHVAVWNPTVGQYLLDPTAPADTVRLGQGYWVFLKNDVPVTQQGTTPGTAFVAQPLNPTWNMIGVPNPSGVPVSSLMFDNGAGGKITFAQASSTQYAILTPNVTNIYRYDAPSNTYQPVSNGEVLQPWQAYWIRVRVPATLEIPTGAGTTTTPTTPTTPTGLPGTP